MEDRARRLFQPPPAPIPPMGAPPQVGYATLRQRSTQHWAPEPARLALLVCATRSGDVLLCTSGLFRLAQISLPQLVGQPHLHCCQLAVASSLEALAVCWWQQPPAQPGRAAAGAGGAAASSSGGGSKPKLHLTTLAATDISRAAPRLHRLGLLAAEVEAALGSCVETWAAVCREWDGAMKEWGDSQAQLREDLAKFATHLEPVEQLLQLLATGALSPGMLQYLSSSLGERGWR